ncbi:hypothetical protein CK203_103475 [Vitis vinifera]|uniref:Retrotransposon gag domain-containing protein n=1 Tax=Vitis vinifera TaxID=29760 RepID=A0A438BL54_VITVI|nr:hypothetical protein CK203_103475 [Vitis vinifera]
MRDHMHPPYMSAPSCIVPPTEQLVIRPHIVLLLPTFHGMESENPYAHIKEFEDDKAKIWLNSLRPRSIRTWTDLQAEFLKKFFPTHRKNGLKRQISNFSAKENEKFYECWERYMEAINACPHHGFDTWLFLKRMDEPNKGEVGKTKSQPNAFNAKVGMYTLNEDIDMKAKVAAMTRRLEELELKKIQECPTIPAVREMFGDQANVIGQFKPNNNASYGNTYNSNWRTIQIFLEAKNTQYTQPGQASQQASNLEQAIVNLSKCKKREISFSTSPKPQVSMKWKLMRESSQVRDVKALITLRSGKEVEHANTKPHVEKEEEEEETEKGRKSKEIRKITDLCTIKRGLNVNKKAFLTEQVSAIIQCKSPLKYKDPGCPTISVMIGGTVVEKALLDLGQISENSKRIIEDVLVQVDNFYYPMDFVVLDTDPIVKETNYVPIILGRPFLATSNAIINCRNGLMQLTFGNMTLELNIFYMSKKSITSGRREGPEEVCIIDTLVEEHCNQKMQEKLNESLGDLDEGLSEPSDLLATLSWRRIEEILPLFNKEEAQEAVKEEPPKLNLKPLPTELKYTYLEENKKCPVVISSSLTTPQECLLEVLKRCKKAIGWQISDLKGISPLVCTHHIYMEERS